MGTLHLRWAYTYEDGTQWTFNKTLKCRQFIKPCARTLRVFGEQENWWRNENAAKEPISIISWVNMLRLHNWAEKKIVTLLYI